MLFCIGSAAFSFAGEEPVTWLPEEKRHNSGDWCETYKGIGKLHSNPEGQFIQEVKIFSRLHYHYAYVDSNLALPNSGRGDEHHSIYAGPNYYLCGNNAKVMAGLQYDDISSAGEDVYDG